ncbi:hypothetical protein V3C99_010392 [Haemonchus contortus]|uniref:Short neuropeptide F n=1 Tax=Haemonchus contortus TaxID=6289 RepID=A0A7I4YH26_HAECO|nr:unnamed protein product [Haemonchus contortus]
MNLLLLLCTLGLVALTAAEPRLRLSSAEEDLVRRAKVLLKKKGNMWGTPSKSYGYTNLAEKRRVRELFGKRSAISATPENEALSDEQYQPVDDLLMELHRDRRGRVRELFG